MTCMTNMEPVGFLYQLALFGATRRTLVSLRQQSSGKQSGAVGACWAHNPEVGRSKLLFATYKLLDRKAIPKFLDAFIVEL